MINKLLRSLSGILFGVVGFYMVIWGLFISFTQILSNNTIYGSEIFIGTCLIGVILYFLAYWLVKPLDRKLKTVIALLLLLLWVVYIVSIFTSVVGIKIL